jgi:hypothetical protein
MRQKKTKPPWNRGGATYIIALEIAVPKPDLGAKTKKKRREHTLQKEGWRKIITACRCQNGENLTARASLQL